MWDRAATPVALREGLVVAETHKDCREENELSPFVTFDIRDKAHRDCIRAVNVPDGRLMDFMIARCIESYERSLAIWPREKTGEGVLEDRREPRDHPGDLRGCDRWCDFGLVEHLMVAENLIVSLGQWRTATPKWRSPGRLERDIRPMPVRRHGTILAQHRRTASLWLRWRVKQGRAPERIDSTCPSPFPKS